MVLGLLSFHCGGGGDDGLPPEQPEPTDPELVSISLVTDSEFTVTNNPKPIQLEVRGTWDDGSNGTLSDYNILVNDVDQGKLSSFSNEEAGAYSLKVQVGNLESAIKVLTVRDALEIETKTFTIIFHIMHDGEAVGTGYNIEASRIDYQMELLKSTFERNNRYTPNSTMPMMEFELATVDPEGNVLSEPGINRAQRPGQEASVLFQDWMWDHYWDPDYYINVWVGDTKNGYSWGIYPTLDCTGPGPIEGIGCAQLDYPKRVEGIALELDNLWEGNWVFPHEMGHVFGLFHIFSGSDCHNDVDHCADTEQYNRDAYESGNDLVTRESCTGQTFTSYNIMDYWRQPTGQRDLSYDQVLRMRKVVDFGNFRGQRSLSEGTPRIMQKPTGG